MMRRKRAPFTLLSLLFLAGCGEPMYDNNGSQHSLLEDREACAMEIEQGPTASAYRENPSAHPDYPSKVFDELNRCIEGKGWKQVRSPQEQEQIRDAVAAQATQTAPSLSIRDSQSTQALVQAVEETLARSSGSEPSGARKD
ncbi:MAG: hypothetical protein ACREJN_09580 [Nitrospiraceae bacterium]